MNTEKINYLDVKGYIPEIKQFIKEKYSKVDKAEKTKWKTIAELISGAENLELEIEAKDQFISATYETWKRSTDEAGITQTQLMSLQQLHHEILKKKRGSNG